MGSKFPVKLFIERQEDLVGLSLFVWIVLVYISLGLFEKY